MIHEISWRHATSTDSPRWLLHLSSCCLSSSCCTSPCCSMLHLTVLQHAAPIITMLDLMTVAPNAALLSHVPWLNHVVIQHVSCSCHNYPCCPCLLYCTMLSKLAMFSMLVVPLGHCYTITWQSHHCSVSSCCCPIEHCGTISLLLVLLSHHGLLSQYTYSNPALMLSLQQHNILTLLQICMYHCLAILVVLLHCCT